jgi:hypothetical protein
MWKTISVVYLTTLSVGRTMANGIELLSDKLERMRKYPIVSYFKVLLRHLPGGKNEDISYNRRCPCLYSNPAPPEY